MIHLTRTGSAILSSRYTRGKSARTKKAATRTVEKLPDLPPPDPVKSVTPKPSVPHHQTPPIRKRPLEKSPRDPFVTQLSATCFDSTKRKDQTEELKNILSKLIEDEQRLLKSLQTRCEAAKKIASTLKLEGSARDAKHLIEAINEVLATLQFDSEKEVEHMKTRRLLEKANSECKFLRFEHEVLQKRYYSSIAASKDNAARLKSIQEENIKQTKLAMSEKQRYSRNVYSEIHAKIQALEDGLTVMKVPGNVASEDSGKLKSAITALLREIQDYKREVQVLKIEKDTLAEHNEKLQAKISKLNLTVKRLKSKHRKVNDVDLSVLLHEQAHERTVHEPRTVEYRLQGCPEEYTSFYKKFLDTGAQYLNQTELELNWVLLLEPLFDRFFQTNALVSQLSSYLAVTQRLGNSQDLYSLMMRVSADLASLLHASTARYWVYDSVQMVIWTYVDGKEYEFSVYTGLFGRIFKEGDRLNSSCPSKEPEHSNIIELALNQPVESLLLYPLYCNDSNALVGFVEVINSDTKAFSYDDEYLLELTLPVINAATLKATRSHSSMSTSRMKYEIIDWSIGMTQCRSLQDMLAYCEHWVLNTFAVSMCRIVVKQQGQGYTIKNSALEPVEFSSGITGKVALSQQKECVHDAYSDKRFNQLVDLNTSLAVSFLPIVDEEECIAVLQLAHNSAANRNDSLMKSFIMDNPIANTFAQAFAAYYQFLAKFVF